MDSSACLTPMCSCLGKATMKVQRGVGRQLARSDPAETASSVPRANVHRSAHARSRLLRTWCVAV